MRCGHCKAPDVDIAHVRGHHQKPLQAPGPAPVKAGPATEGLYRLKGEIYRVRRGPSGFLYPQRALIEGGHVAYTRAPHMIKFLTQAHRMSEAEVAEFGKLTSTCLVCGITLEDPQSVAAGIGPVCITRI